MQSQSPDSPEQQALPHPVEVCVHGTALIWRCADCEAVIEDGETQDIDLIEPEDFYRD